LPAHKEGMRVGDIITHINSRPMPSFKSIKEFEGWFGSLDRPLTMRIARPSHRQNIKYILWIHDFQLPSNKSLATLERCLRTTVGKEGQGLEAMPYDLQHDKICSVIKEFKLHIHKSGKENRDESPDEPPQEKDEDDIMSSAFFRKLQEAYLDDDDDDVDNVDLFISDRPAPRCSL